MKGAPPKLIYLVTEDWYFCSHRLPLAKAALENGYDVSVITQISTSRKMIEDAGIRVIPIRFKRSGKNLLIDLVTIFQLYKIYKTERADIFHHVSLKPVIYGSLASSLTLSRPSPVLINALTGMGYVFTSNKKSVKLLMTLLTLVMKYLFKQENSHLIIQNHDDEKMLIEKNIANKEKISVIRGSGVDTAIFKPCNRIEGESKVITVMCVSRMLADKGINEFVATAKQLKSRGVNARFVLVGGIDLQNPSGISQDVLNKWQQEGSVEWWGRQDSMPEIYQKADIVVLPSYREGLPKVLLEAAACGLPIIASDVPGCREIVLNDHNGLLVSPRDIQGLADAIERLVDFDGLREVMGKNGRKLVEDQFSLNKVILETLNLYQILLEQQN